MLGLPNSPQLPFTQNNTAMKNTADALQKILDATVEQLILAGLNPKDMLLRSLKHARDVCSKKLPDLALEKMRDNDDATQDSDRWLNQEISWGSKFEFDPKDWKQYQSQLDFHEHTMHGYRLSEERIERTAAILSTAAYQAIQLTEYINLFRSTTNESTEQATENVIKHCKNLFDDPEIDFEEERFQRTLRFLIRLGSIGSENENGTPLEKPNHQKILPPYFGSDDDEIPF